MKALIHEKSERTGDTEGNLHFVLICTHTWTVASDMDWF